MARDYIRLRSSKDRELWLGRACERLGIDNESDAIEKALKHLVQSADAYDEIKDELTPEQAKTLSTDVVRINHYPQVNTK